MRPAAARPSPEGRGRSALLIAGLLLIAVSLGIGIGALIASSKTAPRVPIAIDGLQPLKDRYLRARTELEVRTSRGEAVDARAAELVNLAATALLRGDEGSARGMVEELERILAAPRVAGGS